MFTRRISLFVAFALFAQDALAAPKKGTVTVNCPVVGATVTVDGEEIGAVPIDPFELKFGNHTVRIVRPGLIAFEQAIMLRPGDEVVVTAFPKEPRALLTIESNVQGAEVLLDGKSIGKLPLRDAPIAPGRHSMFIRKDGLQPYKEDFTAPPHREFVSRPPLKNKDGSPAGGLAGGLLADAGLGGRKSGGLDLDLEEFSAKPLPKPTSSGLDLDLDEMPIAAPPPKAPPKPVASLDLDLDLGPVTPPPGKQPAPSLDLDLDGGDLALPPPPPAVATAAPTKDPAATTLAFADTKAAAKATPPPARPQIAQKPPPAKPPPLQKKPPEVKKPPPQVAAFVADPIEKEKAEEPPGPPIYTQGWFWGSAAGVGAVALGVALYTGRYIETRPDDPNASISACGGNCTLVMNK